MFRGLFLLVFIINIRTSSCAIEALYEAGQQVWKFYSIIDNWKSETFHDADDNPIIRELKRQVGVVHGRLNQLEKFMGPEKIRDAIKSWSMSATTIRDIDTIELFVQDIDDNYIKFDRCRNESYCSHDTFEIVLEGIALSVKSNIGIIRKSLSEEENIVAAITAYTIIRGAEICYLPQFISSTLIQLFRMIVIAELKTCTILAYENIYGYVKKKDEQEWLRINSWAKKKLEEQFARYINMFSLNIAVIEGAYNRACDPPGRLWTRDESFFELEKTFQTTIFTYNWDNFKFQSCNEILIEKPEQCKPLLYEIPALRDPVDSVAQCAYLGCITACILKSGPYRYQYVNSAELGFLGKNSSCPKDNGEVIDSRISLTGTSAACACTSYRSHNRISLSMMESDIRSNRVITGLRFVRKNYILYIQPREGILESNGYIRKSSQRWIPIQGNRDSLLFAPINKDNRVFFLDDVTLSASFVLTGVKFNKVTRGNVSGFAIEISGTLFDYKTGELFLDKNFRRSRTGWNAKSGKSLKFEPVSSVFTTLPHTVTPSDTKYVSLERSTLKDDFGLSTLPLFDAVPITIEVATALGGFGIFHKGVEGYAGLISLRVYGIKYEEYFKDFSLDHIINDTVLFNCSLH